MDDPYVYPGTNVLKNKPGILDGKTLSMLEREITSLKLAMHPPEFSFSVTGYQRLHQHIFEDLYEWAGEYRSVSMSKGHSMFCFPAYIPDQMDSLFVQMLASKQGFSKSQENFAHHTAKYLNELNAIHPFREGNGRTMRLFLKLLAQQSGFAFEIRNIDADDWMKASIAGFHEQDSTALETVILGALKASV